MLGKVGQERGLLWCPGEAGEQNCTLKDWEALKVGRKESVQQNSRKRTPMCKDLKGQIGFIRLFIDSHCMLRSA